MIRLVVPYSYARGGNPRGTPSSTTAKRMTMAGPLARERGKGFYDYERA